MESVIVIERELSLLSRAPCSIVVDRVTELETISKSCTIAL